MFGAEAYGFSVADEAFTPLARFDADLPFDGAARDVEDIDIDSGRAYLAVWGYGVIIADPHAAPPVELGRFEFPFATTIEAHGDRVYVAASTNGGILPTKNGTITIIPGAAGGSFGTPLSPVDAGGFRTSGVTVADFDNDENLDVAVTNRGGVDLAAGVFTGNNATIFLGDGEGGLTAKAVLRPQDFFFPQALVSGDFNLDGNPDVAISQINIDGSLGQLQLRFERQAIEM